MTYCDQCGTASKPTAKYCQKCGNQLQPIAESLPIQGANGVESRQVHAISETVPIRNDRAPEVPPGVGADVATTSGGFLGAHHPWPRLFARMVDMALAVPLLYLVLFYPIGEYPFIEWLLGTDKAVALYEKPIVVGILIGVLWIPIEAACLALSGTTLGKWLFGIRVLDSKGNPLSYGMAFGRSLRVFIAGSACGIPFVALITGYLSYRRLTTKGVTYWDSDAGSIVTHQSWTVVRAIASAFAVSLFLVSGVLMPLMVAKFDTVHWAGQAQLVRKPISVENAATDTLEKQQAAAKEVRLAEEAKVSREAAAVERPRLPEATKRAQRADAEEAKPVKKAAPIEKARPAKETDALIRKANAGDVFAQNTLGTMYANGNGIPKDVAKAAEWYQRAAEQGSVYGQFNLGTLYLSGIGVPKDNVKGIELLKKAAAQGYDQAQYTLGTAFYFGKDVPKDVAKAVEWFQKASVQGHPEAQGVLGLLYLNGDGVTQSNVLAYAWSSLGASTGNASAADWFKTVEAGVSSTEKAEARQLSSNWKKGQLLIREDHSSSKTAAKSVDSKTIEERKLAAAHPDWLNIVRSKQFQYWRDNVITNGNELMKSEDAVFIGRHLTKFKEWKMLKRS